MSAKGLLSSYGNFIILDEMQNVLQKRALRAVSNSEYRSHSNPLFIKYNQLKISDLCNHNIGIFMYKYCNKLLPSSFKVALLAKSKI